jgi:hypothetical protein
VPPQALRIVAVEGVTHHRARHRGPDARRSSLQHATCQQRTECGSNETADGSDGVEHQTADHHLAPAQRVRQRPVHQRKAGKRQQVGGDDLLHLQAAESEFARDGWKRRQESIYGQRADHRQAGQQQRDAERRRAVPVL